MHLNNQLLVVQMNNWWTGTSRTQDSQLRNAEAAVTGRCPRRQPRLLAHFQLLSLQTQLDPCAHCSRSQASHSPGHSGWLTGEIFSPAQQYRLPQAYNAQPPSIFFFSLSLRARSCVRRKESSHGMTPGTGSPDAAQAPEKAQSPFRTWAGSRTGSPRTAPSSWAGSWWTRPLPAWPRRLREGNPREWAPLGGPGHLPGPSSAGRAAGAAAPLPRLPPAAPLALRWRPLPR